MPVNSDSQNSHISDFLKRNFIAVLATADKQTATPHAATVYYATDSKMNIYILTKNKTAKSRNLDANPQTALAIYEDETQRTAQVTGIAERVDDEHGKQIAQRIMSNFSKVTAGTEETPISKLDAGDYILYRIRPQSIRLAEYRYGVHNELFDAAVPSEESLE